MKRINFIILILLLIYIGIITVQKPAYAAGGHSHYEECNMSSDTSSYQRIKSELPVDTPQYNKNGFHLNCRLWHDKHIVVYGDHTNIEPGKNTFVPGTQHGAGNIDQDEGYYSKNGVRGEYRYHGYDVNGNKYTNINFINDANSNISLSDKRWLYTPWKNLLITPKPSESMYNRAASGGDTETQEWISKAFWFDVKNGIYGDGSTAPNQKFNYIHVLSTPTSITPGEGRAWHQSYTNKKIWYQTFSIPAVVKKPTPVKASGSLCSDAGKYSIPVDTTDMDSQTIELEFAIDGELEDLIYYSNPVKRVTHYTRDDILKWEIRLDSYDPHNISFDENTAKASFRRTYTVGQIKALGLAFTVHGYVTAVFKDGKRSNTAVVSIPVGFNGVTMDAAPKGVPVPPPPPDPFLPPPIVVEPDPYLPGEAFDIVPYPARDDTDMSVVASREVFVNRKKVDDEYFFSGDYVFGIGSDGITRIDVYYTSTDGHEALVTRWIYVYDTKPRAQFKLAGNTKQNRKITVTDNSEAANAAKVIENYPINSYEWTFKTVDGDENSLKLKDISDMYKEMLYKEPGTYQIELTVRNTLGRESDPYVLYFRIHEDVPAAVIWSLNNNVGARNEEVEAHTYETVSTDGDKILSNKLELYYDSDNDGTCEQLLHTWDNPSEFPVFTPVKLGNYKFVNTVTEEFGEDTLPEFVTSADRKTKVVEREFFVDNYIPMTGLYVDIPVIRPEIDAFFMLDESLDQNKTAFIINGRMDIDNGMRYYNILPQVNIWDMHTYTYSQPASTTVYTGTNKPPDTTVYSTNGYSGTLTLTDTTDNGSYQDFGGWEYRTEKKTFTATHSNTVTNYFDETGKLYKTTDSSPAPSSKSINSGGYVGTIPRVSTSGPYNESYTYWPNGQYKTRKRTFIAHYEGTLSKKIKYWEEDWRWVPDYTGHYSGTIYKSIRQPYTDPFRPTSYKYIIYISDGNISELQELKNVLSAADARLILIGPNSIKTQIGHDYFVPNDGEIEELIQDVVGYIAQNSPAVEQYCVLAGEDIFNISTADYDEEDDQLVEKKFQYVQEEDYFDNPTGMESFATSEYSDSGKWVEHKADKFNKTGKFTIYRRVKDQPSTDPRFLGFSSYSGVPQLIVYSHRRPVAYALLNWDYDAKDAMYDIDFTDLSYDLDHQYSREDRGIIERKIMYRAAGGQWIYNTPTRLSPGSYELLYYVKDIENTWSEAFTMNFTLSIAPAMQFEAKLRARDESFSLSGIPASEYLQVYDAWTRFPYGVHLDMALYNGATRVTTLKTVNYSPATGQKINNDINWNNIDYRVPETLPDGQYTFRIDAVGEYAQSASKTFNVTVDTPINLMPEMPDDVMQGTRIGISAVTSKYANSTRVTLFKDTEYQTTLIMSPETNGSTKNWTTSCMIPEEIPDGSYAAQFRAETPNGNTETKTVSFEVMGLKISGVSIEGSWNHWRGQKDIWGKRLSNEPHRFLSLETVNIRIDIEGFAERVEIRFSPELEAMQFTDAKGNVYDYKDDYMGYEVEFPKTFIIDIPKASTSIQWEYTLPLAPSTKSWADERLRSPYKMTVCAYRGEECVIYEIDDIDITGNVYDLTYIQPVN